MESKGALKPAEIAEKLGEKPASVRKWKCEDKWEEELHRPKRGGQPGNQNAKGHGAPKGNTNAETHGAYSAPRLERLTEEERQRIQSLTAEFDSNALAELRRLETKRADLEQKIAALEDGEPEALYLDRLMTMEMPDGGEMKYRSESSAFTRRMVLEAELNRVDGRIIKLLDSFKSRGAETQRMELERKRFELDEAENHREIRIRRGRGTDGGGRGRHRRHRRVHRRIGKR
ncbi:MAG: phage terminase small subunit-related protein [Clostridiales bacterium]|nr:phage terminase small subunit-related protein [Clostridiales bacterium]